MSMKPNMPNSTYGLPRCSAFVRVVCFVASLLTVMLASVDTFAQSGNTAPGVSRPVVQALPSREALQLNAALSRLGRNPRDISALLDAGDAASTLGDFEAATGFYKRAQQISKDNPRALAGLACAMVHDGDPYSAIPLFEQAERAGATPEKIAADRGLAYDLVGDPVTAQQYYRVALAAEKNDEVIRRLAISLAISGEAREVEKTLLPLLREQDKAAWRARAFSLAILGKTKNSIKITNTLLPTSLAKGITPYLEYMPRLTAAQQAAAANLGKFPRASEIGRDDPRLAGLTLRRAPPTRVALLDKGLVPVGKPLGTSSSLSSAAAKPAVKRTEPRKPTTKPRSVAKKKRKRKNRRVAPPEPKPSRRPGSVSEPMLTSDTRAQSPAEILARAEPTVKPGKARSSSQTRRTAKPVSTAASRKPAPRPSQVLAGNAANPETKPVAASKAPQLAVAKPTRPVTTAAGPGFDLAQLPQSSAAKSPSPAAATAKVPEPSFSNMFQDIGRPAEEAAPAQGAVDIRTIKPAKPRPAPKKAAPPSHPSRIWVQLGIGQNTKALAGDWKRLSRKSPELLKGHKAYVSKMNRTNRMLTGPFSTRKAANAFITNLRKGGVEGPYLWSSPAGQVVDAL